MVSRIVLAWLLATVGLAGGLPGGAAGQGSAPIATLADGRVGQIHFESRTPARYFALARREASPRWSRFVARSSTTIGASPRTWRSTRTAATGIPRPT